MTTNPVKSPTSMLPKDLVAQMVSRLASENAADWTREFGASGGKSTVPQISES